MSVQNYGALDSKEVCVAILENQELIDFTVDTQWHKKNKGNIYLGIVSNIEASLDAAFVNYGEDRHGFLPLSDIIPAAYKEDAPQKPKHIFDVVKRKQPILVQVLKEEIGNKGAALTTAISLPGRYLVLMPGSPDLQGISRKIESEDERQRIRSLTQSLKLSDNMGVIVRTAGMDKNKTVLQRDVRYLQKLWEQIDKQRKHTQTPQLLYREQDLVLRTLRDYLNDQVEKIIIDDEASFLAAQNFIRLIAPKQAHVLEFYQKPKPIFSEYNIDAKIDCLFERRVALSSGGSLVIDQTEGLVSIDVNSGRMTKERDQEETAFKTNMEAASEIAKQLRLRDLGGIIVIDFIDMSKQLHRQTLETQFKQLLKQDKARMNVGKISSFGLLEMTRQRIRPSIAEGVLSVCKECAGSGRVHTQPYQLNRYLRQLTDKLASSLNEPHLFDSKVLVELPADMALLILNQRRGMLQSLERQFLTHITVQIHADPKHKEIVVHVDKKQKQASIALPHTQEPVLAPPAKKEISLHGKKHTSLPMRAKTQAPKKTHPKKNRMSSLRTVKDSTDALDDTGHLLVDYPKETGKNH